jgi:hypothetical protein
MSNIRAFGTNQPSTCGVNGLPDFIGNTCLSEGITVKFVAQPVKVRIQPSINTVSIP